MTSLTRIPVTVETRDALQARKGTGGAVTYDDVIQNLLAIEENAPAPTPRRAETRA